MGPKKKAVILLSGGMDSATCFAVAKSKGFECYALSVDYGQRHAFELEMARQQATQQLAARHVVLPLDLRAFGGSALTADLQVPKETPTTGIPSTYVPARNTIFLSLALAWAETLEAHDIFIGVTQVDFSGYPDCRKVFVDAFEATANLATRMGLAGPRIRIHTPLLDLDKAAIIRLGNQLGVDFARTHTCYDPTPDGRSCALCPACRLRLKGFSAAGLRDPLAYLA